MVSAASKRRRRQEGAKKKKKQRVEAPLLKEEKEEEDVDVLVVGLDEEDKEYERFKDVFSKMQKQEEEEQSSESESEDEEEEKVKEEPKEKKLSKKDQRSIRRMTVAQLKQAVNNPEVVEVHDANAADPKLLVLLKSYRNTIPIPRHWCQKRKYLSLKRGFVKPPFELPSYIAATGISRIRESYLQREEEKRARKTTRDNTRAKISRIDIDFHVLQDAFMKHVVKPPMSEFGEMYYEGREKETLNRKAKPGVLSDRLKAALGMPEGYPPPWLINMQRYGPPPSYPSLPIPGLTAPLPEGAQWGYQPGRWGKAPVDSVTAEPLYGDVFGRAEDMNFHQQPKWGAMEDFVSDEEDEDEEDEPAEEPEAEPAPAPVDEPPAAEQVSGTASVPSTPGGIETPEFLDLRKRSQATGQAYQVLEQQSAAPGQAGLMTSAFTYKIKTDPEETAAPPAPAVVAKKETKKRKEFKF